MIRCREGHSCDYVKCKHAAFYTLEHFVLKCTALCNLSFGKSESWFRTS